MLNFAYKDVFHVGELCYFTLGLGCLMFVRFISQEELCALTALSFSSSWL